MSLMDKKQSKPTLGGPLADKQKKTDFGKTGGWASQNKLPESVRKGKSTKAFNRKRAGR